MAKLPKAPKHHGQDPLTKGKTYHDRDNVKTAAEKVHAEAEKNATTEPSKSEVKSAEVFDNQTGVEKNAGTEDSTLTPDSDNSTDSESGSSKSKSGPDSK